MLYAIYTFICKNVGVAIILFTLIIKLALLPIYIKQQKTTAKSAVFMPKVREIQEKYKNNPQKQQDEMMKLQQQGYKPYSGCLPMLLSFLVLFGVIDVVYKPVTHIVHASDSQISGLIEEAYNVELTALFVNEVGMSEDDVMLLSDSKLTAHNEVVRDAQKILEYYNENCIDGDTEKAVDISDFTTLTADNVRVMNTAITQLIKDAYAVDVSNTLITNTDIYKITDAEQAELDALTTTEEKAAYTAEHRFGDGTVALFTTVNNHYGYYTASGESTSFTASSSLQRELYALECYGTVNNGVAYSEVFSDRVVGSLRTQLDELYENLNFLGIPLGQVPMEHMGFPMILVPIMSFVLAMAQTLITNRNMAVNNPEAAKQQGCMKYMMYIMPLFSLWIAFTVPAGAGFYWAISYAFGIVQTIVLNKLYNPQRLKEEAQNEYNLKQNVVTVEAVKEKVVDDKTGETLTQKEINRRKLAEARKADALKYGEEYKDDDDDE